MNDLHRGMLNGLVASLILWAMIYFVGHIVWALLG
jgi:hypothetical protein